jgi:nucleoside-diphosphate-sugar epimerase
VVDGLLLALDHPHAIGQAYNITNDQAMTQVGFLSAIADEMNARRPRLHVPYRALYAAGYAAERLAELTRSRRRPPITRLGVAFFGTDNRYAIGKARRELGYVPKVALREGVHRAADWYRSLASTTPSVQVANHVGGRVQ